MILICGVCRAENRILRYFKVNPDKIKCWKCGHFVSEKRIKECYGDEFALEYWKLEQDLGVKE